MQGDGAIAQHVLSKGARGDFGNVSLGYGLALMIGITGEFLCQFQGGLIYVVIHSSYLNAYCLGTVLTKSFIKSALNKNNKT